MPNSPRICRSPDHCQHPVGENGYFCNNHFRILDTETRHLVNSYPWKPGPAPDGRNSMLHRAMAELRTKLNVIEPVEEPDGAA